jgi:hypothetical protein
MAGFVRIRQVESRACLSFGRTLRLSSDSLVLIPPPLADRSFLLQISNLKESYPDPGINPKAMDQGNSGLIEMFKEYQAQMFYDDYGRILTTEDPAAHKFMFDQFVTNYSK